MTTSSVEHYDFVVAGSGAGGAAVAARLVEGGARVLVVEKGGFARPHNDAARALARYYAGAGFSTALGNALLPIPRGITVGGTTTINSGTCMRTPGALLARWQEATAGTFEAAAFEGYLDEAWRRLRVARAPAATMSRSSELIVEGFRRLGLGDAERLDRCVDGCEGSARCCFVCPRDAKLTSYKAFLEPLREDPHLRLVTGSEIVRVTPPRRGATRVRARVRARAARRSFEVTCDGVVLAAGALATPWFVRRFGLGPHARRAGDELSVHPAAKVFALFDEPVGGARGVPQGVGLDDPADAAIRYEGVATPRELAALTMPVEGRRLAWWMERHEQVATFGFMIRDESRGRVRYPLGRTRPLVRYHLAARDLQRMLHGMRRVGEAFFAAGARRVLLPLNIAGNEFASADELAAADLSRIRPAALQTMAFHPLGTCGLGRVVDANLELCPGVHVCDGSVVPEAPGVNPQITIYAFALRLADRLLA